MNSIQHRKHEREQLLQVYTEKHGDFKTDADSFFSPFDAVKVQKEIEKTRTKANHFVFASVSANRGTHEWAIYQYLKQIQQNTTFIVGDLLADVLWSKKLEKKMQEELYHGASSMVYMTLDAHHLPFANESIDELWDCGGCLWYCSQNGKEEELLRTMYGYYRSIKENGIIVFDGFDGLPILTNGKKYVRSTFGRMQSMKEWSSLQNELLRWFEFQVIFPNSENKKMMMMKKKIKK